MPAESLTRRGLLAAASACAAVIATPVACAPASPAGLDAADWQRYRTRFISGDGRVVDTGNRGVSHSEGQGYAMLLAVASHDRASFEHLWRWTQENLQVRDDHLFAWRWDPAAKPDHVSDRNSAADGDLLIAWALARAGREWQAPEFSDAARKIASDVLVRLVRDHDRGAILLPGPKGFVHPAGVTVNLSYWVFPALHELDVLSPAPHWRALIASGLELLKQARFGPFELPPDWLALSEPLQPSPLFAPVFGYNAVRIPLYLVWAGLDDEPVLHAILRFAAAYAGQPPAEINLLTGALSPERVSPGVRAILQLTGAARGDPLKPAFPDLDGEMDYFAASLLLLTKLAYAERFPQ